MPHDDFIITIGALVLGLGLLSIINRSARAYATEPEEVAPPKCPYWHPPRTPCPYPNLPDPMHPEGDPFNDFMNPMYRWPNYNIRDPRDKRPYQEQDKIEFPSDVEIAPESPYRDFPVSTYARAYAVTPVPCAPACAPFKNSPATYATCCKQHAAAKPAAKPAPKPATLTYKPQSTTQLIEGAFSDLPFYRLETQGPAPPRPAPPKPQPKTTIPVPAYGRLTSGGGSGRATCNGRNCYRLTNNRCPGTVEDPNKSLGCSNCKPGDVTVRVNHNNCSLVNYEATGIIQFSTNCGGGGDEATIKHYGPSHHSEADCCWELAAVFQNGAVYFGGEGNHPNTDKKQQKTTNSVGNIAGKQVGIKSVIWRTGGMVHHEIWVDPTGSGTNWQWMGARDIPQWGVGSQTTNMITKNGSPQQVEFRNDCKGTRWVWTEVAEIVPGQRA